MSRTGLKLFIALKCILVNITCGVVTIKYASWTRRVGVASQGVHVLR